MRSDECSSKTTLRRAVASGSTTSGWPTRPSGGTNHLAPHSKARVCLRVLHVLSADEIEWRLSMVPMHGVFEYPRSRLYTYLSLSLPSGIVHVFEGYTCKYCEQYALLTSHQGST